jgi:DNA-binding response OmpR family regulator
VDILVFSDAPEIGASFRVRKNGKLVRDVRVLPWSEFRKMVRSVRCPTLCYLDLSRLESARRREVQRLASRADNVIYGLVDPEGSLEDVAEAFHQGAVDYLDKPALRKGITAERLRRVCAYLQRVNPQLLHAVGESSVADSPDGYIESGVDWSAIQTGREYTFHLMFIELDGKELMEKKYGVDNLSTALGSFRSYVEGFVKQYQGRLWNWFRFGGIVLFPFSHRGNQALTCLFRLMLFRHFYDVESSQFPNFLSFRAGMLIGNLSLDGSNTGTTVSDSLNSVFHLGQQFARPGNVYVTQEVLRHAHPVLAPFFTDAGVFEGRAILRMRLPVYGP